MSGCTGLLKPDVSQDHISLKKKKQQTTHKERKNPRWEGGAKASAALGCWETLAAAAVLHHFAAC